MANRNLHTSAPSVSPTIGYKKRLKPKQDGKKYSRKHTQDLDDGWKRLVTKTKNPYDKFSDKYSLSKINQHIEDSSTDEGQETKLTKRPDNDHSQMNKKSTATATSSLQHGSKTKTYKSETTKRNENTSNKQRLTYRSRDKSSSKSTSSTTSSSSDNKQNSPNTRRRKHRSISQERIKHNQRRSKTPSKYRSHSSPHKSLPPKNLPYFTNSKREEERRHRLYETYKRELKRLERRSSYDRSRNHYRRRSRSPRSRSPRSRSNSRSRHRRNRSRSKEKNQQIVAAPQYPLPIFPPYPYQYMNFDPMWTHMPAGPPRSFVPRHFHNGPQFLAPHPMYPMMHPPPMPPNMYRPIMPSNYRPRQQFRQQFRQRSFHKST